VFGIGISAVNYDQAFNAFLVSARAGPAVIASAFAVHALVTSAPAMSISENMARRLGSSPC
jgi:hypothetical protein